MSDFEALLKRSFAEADEPVDDGFSARLVARVSRRESDNRLRTVAHSIGMAAAGAAAVYALVGLFGAHGQEAVDIASIEVARAEGAFNAAAPRISWLSSDLMQSVSAGLTQILLATAALVGGAVAYRNTARD
jgi:hypothetical protein